MNKLIVGCDPDVDGKGFAIYEGGVLTELRTFSLIEIYQYIDYLDIHGDIQDIELHIEDLNANKSSAFNHKGRQSKAVQNKISESVGRCKHAQIEVERIAEYFNIKIVRHKVSSMWKKDKKQFEMVTGWTGQSNEDTRSAAYFGWLGTKK
jgi:hypothetical protein